jgi:hypothetical protein
MFYKKISLHPSLAAVAIKEKSLDIVNYLISPS